MKFFLLICSMHFWPENFRINDVVFAIKKYFIVNVITGQPNYPEGNIYNGYNLVFPKKTKKNKISILRLPIVSRGRSSKIRLIINYISYIFSFLFFFSLYKIKADIFFVYATSPIFQAIPPILFSKILNKPTVLWVQDLWPDNLKDTNYIKNKFLLNLILFFVKKIYQNCDLILCQSPTFKKKIKNLTKTKIKVFYNPSNFKFKKFYPKKKKTFHDIFYTGNLGYGQNFNIMFNALKKIDTNKEKIRLIIYGNGKNKKNLLNFVKNNNIKNIIFKKPVSPKKLEKIILNADSFFITLDKGSGLSNTLPAKFQTYLAYGKPILSTAGNAVNSLIRHHKIGFCCNNELQNTKKMYDKIFKIKNLNNNELKKIYLNSKKLYYKYFELNSGVEKLTKILTNIITKKKENR